MPIDDPNELFYLVDDQDNELGSISRQEAHADNTKVHRAVYVLVTNDKNQMLMQLRSMTKDLYPGIWALGCAGHVKYGQSYRQAAMEELQEELHIAPELFYVTKLLVKAEGESEYCDIFMCKIGDMPMDFDKDEITDVAWVPINEIQAFVEKNPLPPADMEVLRLLLYIQ